MHKPLRSLVSAAVLSTLANTSLHAAGFALYTEGSAVGIGNAGAGLAAEAADASIGWYNPAGLALIRDQQAVIGGVGIFPSAELTGFTTFRTRGFPGYTETFRDLDGAKDAFVPFFHYARPVGENTTVGLSIVAPFGLATDWPKSSPVRYSATFTELITVNVSPEIGGKITDNFALGGGLDLQYARVKFNRILGSPAVLNASELPPNLFDSLSYNEGDSFGVGFHAGVMGIFNDNHTRIGLNYQSRMKHTFHGYSKLSGILADPSLFNANTSFRTDNLFSNNIEFPEVVTLSGYHDVNERFALLGSIIYTRWDVINTIELNNVAAALPGGGNAAVRSSSTLNYDNSWRFALGANYKLTDCLMLRGGVSYDETPLTDANRDVRLPDEDRVVLSIGAHYDVNPEIGVDVGYTYLYAAHDPRVNKTETIGTTSNFTVNARGDSDASLIGVQAVWHMDRPEPLPPTK
ncbi:transporter [Legionella israelensis]|uniref:Transporter n=2 Tax=Legionella israelensis TaxID=454 RepID=A0A0W0V7C5_9GAMM|nr:long chain fatty acid transporter [Legionella israelensis]SCY05479.1 long-chain fatty acid transport protein [Legionella israelensis DSM 19235]QBR83731.1 transporter [Legionella israelensis]QBS08823.1 transporter [Legionella israelensis]QDP73087.1 transporter [Legionella israelensis]